MKRSSGIVIMLCAILCSALVKAEDAPPMSMEIYDQWITGLSNWGRWGKDDELGTLNLITPEIRKQAAKLIKDSVTVSLALDIQKSQKPTEGTANLWSFMNEFRTMDVGGWYF